MKPVIMFAWVTGLWCLAASAWAATVPVTVQPFPQIVVYPNVTVPASVVTVNDTRISAEVSAVIRALPVQVGETVEQGTVLVQLEPGDYALKLKQAQAALRALEARLDLAEYQLERAQALSQQQAVSEEVLRQRQAELDRLKAERDAQQAAVAAAKRDLDKCTIKAPFKAIVDERMASVGELAAPGTPLLHVLDAQHVEVTAKVQAQDIASLQRASVIEFSAQDRRYPVSTRVITPAFDPLQRSREVRLRFKDEPALPGAPGTLAWRNGHPHIPPDLMVRRDGQLGLFIVDGEQARFVPLPQAQEGRPAPAPESLPKEARVIVDGRFTVREGDSVAVR